VTWRRGRRWVEGAAGDGGDGGGVDGVAARGRPLRGGTATTTSGGDLQGFKRSVETLSVFVPICSLKKRSVLSKTRYGPSYSGVRGAEAPSLRTRTWRARRSSSGSCSGAGLE
jgi:hypothetical protein